MITPPPTSQGAHKFSSLLLEEMGKYAQIVPWQKDTKCHATLVRGALAQSQIQRIKGLGDKLVIWYGGWDLSSQDSILAIKNSVRQASGVIFNSRFGMETVHKKVCSDLQKETVIHNGSRMGTKANLTGNKTCLVACADYDRPDRLRALQYAIEAVSVLKKYHDCKLWVAGKLSKADSRIDRVLGHVSDSGVLTQIRSEASVLVHMVKDDQCPNTVVEALGQGIPVVCHKHSGTPEIVSYFGRALPDVDPGTIADQIAILWQVSCGWQGQWLEHFKKELSIEAVAQKYLKFIEEIL